jgi:signal transduction histidine kinase
MDRNPPRLRLHDRRDGALMPTSLRLRLAVAGAGVVCLALALAYFGLVFLFERHAYRTLSDDLDVIVRQIIGRLEVDAAGAPSLPQPLRDPRFEAPLSGLYWQVAGGPKPLRSRSLWDAKLDVPVDNPSDGQTHRHQIHGPDGKLLLVAERRVSPYGSPTASFIVAVASDLSRLRKARDEFAADLLPSLGVLAAFLAGAMWVQLTLGLGPLTRLRTDVAEISKGRARRLPDAAPAEVQPLVAEVNALLEAQDAEVDRARAHAADLAHGLKTPLSAIANDAARLRDEGQDEIARSLQIATEAMRRHIERELTRARLRGGGRSRHGPGAPLRVIAESVVAIVARTERGEAVAFRVEIPVDARWPMDKNDLTEALGNLLDNATRYAKSSVRVSSPAADEIDVEDDGPGVEPGAEALIRKRGGRLDESGGAGLGIAIVQEILVAYGGSLQFDRSALGGLKAKLALPLGSS